MNFQKIIEEFKKNAEELIEKFQEEIKTIRTQRPHTGLIEDLTFDYYGKKTKIKSVATISIKPPSQIIINSWDKNTIKSIEEAIKNSNLSLTPQIEGNILYLNLPPLTEERKNELIKFLSLKKENFRIKFRKERDEILKKAKSQKERGEISEDDFFKIKDKAQEIVDDFNKKIEKIFEQKEKEIKE